MEREFDQELNTLKKNLLNMPSLTEETIAKSIKVLAERDSLMAQEIIVSITPTLNNSLNSFHVPPSSPPPLIRRITVSGTRPSYATTSNAIVFPSFNHI